MRLVGQFEVLLQVDSGEEAGDVEDHDAGHHGQLEERQRSSNAPKRNGHERKVVVGALN